MNSINKKVFLFLIFSIIIMIQSVEATLYEDLTYEEMIERADLIIIGKSVGEVNVRYEKVTDPEVGDFEVGYTEWEIAVTSYLKGNSQGETILVSTPGPSKNTNDNRTDYIVRSSEYSLDELIEQMEVGLVTKVSDIIFFLEEKDGHFHPIIPSAIVPLNVVYWEGNIDREIVNQEEIEPKVIEELAYLKEYLEETPYYSAEGKLLNSNYSLYLYTLIAIVLLAFIALLARNKIINRST
ncbi:hypothetical protein IMZ08_17480 [Bacillus luteolus]|uniref:SURF1-like protein n=1 Tax=Litchfieldia luteola TaxID=682179 RepID=A0ABR9QMV0_9BACI|nr:hypothetical protein [Cytobacillus luteolus]MBE4909829.1 hypothetical protein [Cytobacillus luteolus]MBP1942622.1 hypothetical protein [Cytobacillus luteolus]